MLISVSIMTLPQAGTVAAFDAYKSYPAANAEEREGGFAEDERSLTWRAGGGASNEAEAIGGSCGALDIDGRLDMLARGFGREAVSGVGVGCESLRIAVSSQWSIFKGNWETNKLRRGLVRVPYISSF